MDRVCSGGGSLALAELIDEHGPALAADFLSEYGIRLADVVFVWSPREVFALVEGLPPTSRFQAHLAGGEKWRDFWGWGTDRHMLASLFDLHVQINTEKGKKAFTYPRPGVKKPSEGVPFMSLVPRSKPKGD